MTMQPEYRGRIISGAKLALLISVLLSSGMPELTAGDFGITGLTKGGVLTWTNAFTNGVCSVEESQDASGPWLPGTNVFTSSSAGQTSVPTKNDSRLFRLRAVDVSATPQGFTNLVYSYGILETVAGTGAGQLDGVSYWLPWYEAGPGQWAALSRPHVAQADRAGNIYIADKNSHSILKVSPDGSIRTLAGTHVGGYNGDGPALATNLNLNMPNGLWVRADGTVYVLDTENGRVRRVDTNGVMSTLCLVTSDGSALPGGRGIWVNDSETTVYFCASTKLRRWSASGGLKTIASSFIDLGTLYVESSGNILVCDRGGNSAYRVTPSGGITAIAGNGLTYGGGDGYPALETGLYGLRSIWPLPNGGYVLLTHDGCQLWYVDAGGIVRLLLNGAGGRTHAGDGGFFYTPEYKISEGRSVTVDHVGNIIITESDWGFVRRIRFSRMAGY